MRKRGATVFVSETQRGFEAVDHKCPFWNLKLCELSPQPEIISSQYIPSKRGFWQISELSAVGLAGCGNPGVRAPPEVPEKLLGGRIAVQCNCALSTAFLLAGETLGLICIFFSFYLAVRFSGGAVKLEGLCWGEWCHSRKRAESI